MPLVWLPTDLRESVLDICTAKELVAVQATCHDFRAHARAALDKPRFQERKEAAALGVLLAESSAADWFRQGSRPPNSSKLHARLGQMINRYWSTEREVAVGMFVVTLDMRLVGWVHKVHEDGTCDVVPIDDEDEAFNEHVRAIWPAPASMRSGMLAIQDWDPRAFAYFMFQLSAPDEAMPAAVLDTNLLLTDIVKDACLDLGPPEGVTDGSSLLMTCEVPPPQLLFAAVCEWDSDVSFDGLSGWLARIYRRLESFWRFGSPVKHWEQAADEILKKIFNVIGTMPVEPAARLFNLVHGDYEGSVWTHPDVTLDGDDIALEEEIVDIPKFYVLERLLQAIIPPTDELDVAHVGQVLHLCLMRKAALTSGKIDVQGIVQLLIDALRNRTMDLTVMAEHHAEDPAENIAECGHFLQIVCFGTGNHDREQALQLLVLNHIDVKVDAHEGAVHEEDVQAAGHFLSGFFESADEQPPRVLMDWLETTGDVSMYATILRECFDEDGLKGLVSHLDRWADDSMERAAELLVAWHPDGGRPQAVWDMMDTLVPPWWSRGGRAKARRERLLDAARALGFGRS